MPKPDKLTQKILEFMLPLGAGKTCSLSDKWDCKADASIGDLCRYTGAGREETLAWVAYMAEHGLVSYRHLKSRSGPVAIGFSLAHEGLHYKEFRRLTRRERWLERLLGFVSGVLVSVIGGLVLLLAEGRISLP